MKEADNGNAIRVYEIMKEKNYTPEEIEAFLEFLDRNTAEITQPLVLEVTQPLVQRMDFLELLLYGIAVLVVIAPEVSRRLSNRFLGTS